MILQLAGIDFGTVRQHHGSKQVFLAIGPFLKLVFVIVLTAVSCLTA